MKTETQGGIIIGKGNLLQADSNNGEQILNINTAADINIYNNSFIVRQSNEDSKKAHGSGRVSGESQGPRSQSVQKQS